jgi:hypothetical protein
MAAVKRRKANGRTQVAKSVINKTRRKSLAPLWNGCEEWNGEKYHQHFRLARAHYYTSARGSDLVNAVFDWMKQEGYSRDEIRAAKAAGVATIGVNTAILCRLLLDGMLDFHQEHANYWEGMSGTYGAITSVIDNINPAITNAINEGKFIIANTDIVEDEEPVNVVKPPTIQERIMEQACEAAQGIDNWLEAGAKGTYNFNVHFVATGVTQAHARKMIAQYQPQLDEYLKLLSMPTPAKLRKMNEEEVDLWEQLREGYSHMSKKQINHMITALQSIIDALNFVIDSSKANRKPRKSKPKSATKLVEKIKYLKKDDKLQLNSVSPETIVGAQELWIYNVQYRKFGRYVAADSGGLSVKGTSIVNYDLEKSVCKTLRKPTEQLKDFKNAGKVKLRTFFEDIKTTDIKLNGRSNEKTIFLKVT